MFVCLELSFENFDLGSHGDNFLVIGGLGTLLSLLVEPIILVHGKGHERSAGDSGKVTIKVIIVVALDVRFEVVARNNVIGIEEETNGIVNIGTTSKQLSVVFVELAIDLVDIAVHHGCKHPKVVEVVAQGLSCGKRVECGKPHDDLVHKWAIFHAFEGVLVVVGE
jgi:hypothetical protein